MRPNRKTPVQTVRIVRIIVTLALLLSVVAGCDREDRPLRLADLTPDERVFVERFIVLERARALALVDAAAGDAALDSLAAAWGDSALVEARASLPDDAVRQAALQVLLAEILDAEEDSLVLAPTVRRLSAPLADPPARAAAEEAPAE